MAKLKMDKLVIRLEKRSVLERGIANHGNMFFDVKIILKQS